jgi:uncharacterized protein (TIGR03067 family)
MNTLLVVLGFAVGAPALKDKESPPSIVGEWDVESISTNGNPAGIRNMLRYTFTSDGKWLIHRGGQELPLAGGTRSFNQDGKANPPSVDLLTTANAGGGTQFNGIFKIDGDTLTICGTRSKAAERPKTFEPGAGITIYVLKRIKKE